MRRPSTRSPGSTRPASIFEPSCGALGIILAAIVATGCVDATSSGSRDGPGIRFQEVATFGCLDCEGPRRIGSVAGLFIDRGAVWVVTVDAPHVRRFPLRDGEEALSFGRSGDGPGELRLPRGIMSRRGGGVIVFDYRGRAVAFSERGAPLATRRISGSGVRMVSPGPGGERAAVSVQSVREPRGSVIVIGPDGGLTDSLPVPDDIDDGSPRRYTHHALGAAVSDDGRVVIGYGLDVYRLRQVVPEVTNGGRDIEPEERDPEEIEAIVRTIRRVSPDRSADDIRQEARFRAHFDSNALRVDSDGRLWVRTQRGGDRTTIFDVFDRRLRYLGPVRLSEAVGRFHLHDGYLAAETRGETGEPRITVWRRVEG